MINELASADLMDRLDAFQKHVYIVLIAITFYDVVQGGDELVIRSKIDE